MNTSYKTIDGIQYMPQTTVNWTIEIAGERLKEVATAPLEVTDLITGTHQICEAGDPTGGLNSQLNLRVEARDQVNGGGLATVSLTDSVISSFDDATDVLTMTIPVPTLPLPDGTETTSFSHEYRYVLVYDTCTTSGGMDAPGTVYSNYAEVAGKTYEKIVTQNNKGSGTGTGVPRGSIEVSKAIADTPGSDFVTDGTMFTVHVAEFAPGLDLTGEPTVEYDLNVPLNGDPVAGLDAPGNGWTAVLTEPTFGRFW